MATKYENYITGDDATQGFYATLAWSAQTFTPSTTHVVTSVKLKLRRTTVGTTGTMTVSITATSGGEPSGSALCSGTYDVTDPAITTDAGGNWYEITFGTGYLLVASTMYAIVVKAGTDDTNNATGWRRDGAGASYAGGQRYQTTDEGDSWTAHSDEDFMFEEWGGDAGVTTFTPTVIIISAENIAYTTIDVNANILDLGSTAVTQHGICWSTSVDPTISNSKTTLGAGAVGAFSSQATGLTPGTPYYIRAYATNSVGTDYSANLYIVTVVAVPSVVTYECSVVGETTATGNGNITSIGDSAVSQHGHCWSTSQNPTVSDSKTELGAGSVGTFTSSITGLTGGLTYYCRAYATNTSGTAYGNQVTILPSASNAAPTVTTQACSAIISTGATGNGNITSLGVPASVTSHGHCWATSSDPTVADSKRDVGATTSTGAFISAMRGMTTGTLYYVRAYATNQAGTSYGANVVVVPNVGGGGQPVYPSDAITRVTGLIHRYDRRAGIYQSEISLGGVSSVLDLPYELTSQRATAEKKQEQDDKQLAPVSVLADVTKLKRLAAAEERKRKTATYTLAQESEKFSRMIEESKAKRSPPPKIPAELQAEAEQLIRKAMPDKPAVRPVSIEEEIAKFRRLRQV